MTPTPTMMAAAAEGTLKLSFWPNGTALHVDIDHIMSSKCWIGKPTSTHNSPFQPPGTQSYAQQSVANQTPPAATLVTNHGQRKSDDLTAVIHQVIKLEIAQFAKDFLANICFQQTQQHTALPTITMTATMMMTTTTLPPPMNPNYLCDPIDLATIWCEINLELPRIPTTNKDTTDNTTSNATSSTAISSMLMTPTTPPTTLPMPLNMRSVDAQSIAARTDCILHSTDCIKDTKLQLPSLVTTKSLCNCINPHLQPTATQLIVLTATSPPHLFAPHTAPTEHPCHQPPPAPPFSQPVWIPLVPPASDPASSNNLQLSDTDSNLTNPIQQPAATINSLLLPPTSIPV